MPTLIDSLEIILRDFGVTTEAELIKKRTTEKQVKPSEIIEQPRLVQMTADQCRKLCEKVKLDYYPGYEKRVIERVTTTETPDRYGDIVRCKGANVESYRKNPVVLFAHRSDQAPVGKSIKLWLDNAIMGWRSWDLYFGAEIEPNGYCDYIFRLIASGAMPGASIGFMPTQIKCDHSPEDRVKLGLGKWGVEYLGWDYLEHSACSVPANPEALANSLKAIGSERLKSFFSQPDIAKMETLKIFDGNILDVFARALGVERTIIVPPVENLNEKYGEEVKDIETVLRPYPSEHACRLVEPIEGAKTRRKNGAQEHEGKKYDVIYQKQDDEWVQQAYRYPKETWTASEAKAHCKSHKGIKFEAAAEKSVPEDGCCGDGSGDFSKTIADLRTLIEKQEKQIVVNVTVPGLDDVFKKMNTEIESLRAQLADLTEQVKAIPAATPAGEKDDLGVKLQAAIAGVFKSPSRKG